MSQGRLQHGGLSEERSRNPAGRSWAARIPRLLGALLCFTLAAAPAAAQDPPLEAPAETLVETGARVEAGIVLLPNAGTPPAVTQLPPTDLQDLPAWLRYKLDGHVEALPYHSRLFYRRGLLLHQSGNFDEALRLVHGAVELDPHYLAPHLTLASWLLMRNPSQALLHYAALLDIARKNFLMQLALSANAIYLGLQALLLALIAAGLLIVWMHQAELRHAWSERLVRWLSPLTVRWWTWGLLVIPFVVGLGPVLPAAVFLALLWPLLKRNERAVFIMLTLFVVTAPFMASALDVLATPLRQNTAPFFGVAMDEKSPYRESTHARLRERATAEPNNAFVQFALGWTARRGGAIEEAAAAYQSALEQWPEDDRILNNLGNTHAMQGRPAEAVEAYEGATRINPSNAAAHFNRAQVKTQQFDFREATEGLSRASALDFDMVKAFQAQQTEDGYLPLVEQWLAPQTFWDAMPPVKIGGVATPSLPPLWRSRIEFSGWPFSTTAIALIALALAFGIRQNRAIPIRGCSNCGDVVCRRCAERRRERALCRRCAAIDARAESQEFGRVLLSQHRRQHQQTLHLIRTALATLIPGYGLLAFKRIASAVMIFAGAAALASMWLGVVVPFPYEAGLHLPDSAVPVPVLVALTILLYATSLIGYFSNVARARAQAAYLAAPTRSRVAQSTERNTAAAA